MIWSIKFSWFGLEAINIFKILKWVFIHMLVFSRDWEQKLEGTYYEILRYKSHLTLKSCILTSPWASHGALVVKNLPANAGDIRDVNSIPGSGLSTRGGHGNPLQYSWLENPMDTRAWKSIVQRVAKSQT